MRGTARRHDLLPFDGKRHDHDLCVEKALREAEQLCARRGARLTKLRKKVLALVWTSHSPVEALTRTDRALLSPVQPCSPASISFIFPSTLPRVVSSITS